MSRFLSPLVHWLKIEKSKEKQGSHQSGVQSSLAGKGDAVAVGNRWESNPVGWEVNYVSKTTPDFGFYGCRLNDARGTSAPPAGRALRSQGSKQRYTA